MMSGRSMPVVPSASRPSESPVVAIAPFSRAASRARADVARLARRRAAIERELERRPPLDAPQPKAEPVPQTPPAPVWAPLVTEENVEALERRIGARLLLYAGMVVLLLGVSFF